MLFAGSSSVFSSQMQKELTEKRSCKNSLAILKRLATWPACLVRSGSPRSLNVTAGRRQNESRSIVLQQWRTSNSLQLHKRKINGSSDQIRRILVFWVWKPVPTCFFVWNYYVSTLRPFGRHAQMLKFCVQNENVASLEAVNRPQITSKPTQNAPGGLITDLTHIDGGKWWIFFPVTSQLETRIPIHLFKIVLSTEIWHSTELSACKRQSAENNSYPKLGIPVDRLPKRYKIRVAGSETENSLYTRTIVIYFY